MLSKYKKIKFASWGHVWNRFSQIENSSPNKYARLRQIIERQVSEERSISEKKLLEFNKSLRYAQLIQKSLLPDSSLFEPYFQDFFFINQAKETVSGDIYWAKTFNTIIVVASIDCTGHGVPASLLTVFAHDALNQLVTKESIGDLGTILEKLHKMVRTSFKQTKNGSGLEDGMDIAIISYNKENNELAFSGANRPLFLVKKNEHDVTKIRGMHYGIGGYTIDITRVYSNHYQRVEKGDIIYLFSDGFVDQFGEATNKKFKSSKFKAMLFNHRCENMKTQQEIFLSTLEKWKGMQEQTDDILLMGLKI